MYLGHNGWTKPQNGEAGFNRPNFGRSKSSPESKVSIAEQERQKKCRRNLYIVFAVCIALAVIVSIVLVVTIVNSKYSRILIGLGFSLGGRRPAVGKSPPLYSGKRSSIRELK